MKQLIKIILITLLPVTTVIGLTACDNSEKTINPKKLKKATHNTTSTIKNTAIIKIGQKDYNLPIRLCNKPRTSTFKGQSITHYSVLAQQGLVENKKVSYPVFSISGVTGDRKSTSNYKLELNNKGLKTTYSGKAPYNIFNGNTLHYKGQTKQGKKTIPIEITINCS